MEWVALKFYIVLFFNTVYCRYGKINCSSVFLNFEFGIHSSILFPACLNDLQLAGEVQSDTKSTSDPLHLIFNCLPKSSGTNHRATSLDILWA